jgi:hypothetical protein
MTSSGASYGARRSSRFAVIDQPDGNRQVDANQPFADRISPVVHHHDRVGELMGAQKLKLMQKERFAAHVHERLGEAVEHRGEPRAFSTGENDRLLSRSRPTRDRRDQSSGKSAMKICRISTSGSGCSSPDIRFTSCLLR